MSTKVNMLDLSKYPQAVMTPDQRGGLHIGLIREQVVRSCLNCDHWASQLEQCDMYKQRPPATTIVMGCPMWTPDIPF